MEVVPTQIIVKKLSSTAKKSTGSVVASAIANPGKLADVKVLQYECAVRVAWYGRVLLNGRSLGETTGFIDIPDISNRTQSKLSTETCTTKCFCELKRWAGSHDSKGRMLELGDPASLACENWGSEHKLREIDAVEKTLKDFVTGDGIAKVLQKVDILQKELATIAVDDAWEDDIAFDDLPDPTVKLEAEEEIKATPDVQAFIDKLTIQSKGCRYEGLFQQTLSSLQTTNAETTAVTELNFDFCSIEDADVAKLVAVLKDAKANETMSKLNLSNNKIQDAGIQALVIALAGGMLPQLKELNLQENAFSQVGTNMLKGLSLMRKSVQLLQ